ncbi:MAG: type VI secretion system baseplate subunit TssE [Campylobacterales bacterium]|nr:type VI secretion system baseplate subunit TssE [Campylobacterales bacterium]
MYKGSLFDRLMSKNFSANCSSYEDSLCESIASNISLIFSTNIGSSQSASDYGRPDLDDVNLNINETLSLIERRSYECLKKFEPRLLNVNIIISKERLSFNEMSILIEAFIKVNGKNKEINFNAVLTKSGKVKVERYGI